MTLRQKRSGLFLLVPSVILRATLKSISPPKVLVIIQARLTSTRLPRKVLMTVGGKTIISRVCTAARDWPIEKKIVVAWAHKFPHLDENDVLGRFREVVLKYKPDIVIRLTSDCPLLNQWDIREAWFKFNSQNTDYYSNHLDGKDVQIFKPELLWTKGVFHKEHVIADFTTKPTGLSVNTIEDLERIRKLCETR